MSGIVREWSAYFVLLCVASVPTCVDGRGHPPESLWSLILSYKPRRWWSRPPKPRCR
jgi:hypothetical protein